MTTVAVERLTKTLVSKGNSVFRIQMEHLCSGSWATPNENMSMGRNATTPKSATSFGDIDLLF